MSSTSSLLVSAYAAFNRRDIDAIFALMADSVSWPRASEGGTVVGKEEIRAYWTRQWSEFDPHVEPVEIIDLGDKVDVRVHQLVKSLHGDILSDTEVWHTYTMSNGQIGRMDLKQTAESAAPPSAAFGKHDQPMGAASQLP